MDEDEEMFRLMNEEDDFYMGDRDEPDDDYEQQHRQPNQTGGGMGCLVMLPLLAGTLTFVVLLILSMKNGQHPQWNVGHWFIWLQIIFCNKMGELLSKLFQRN